MASSTAGTAAAASPYTIVFQPPADVSAYDVRLRPEEQTPAARAALPPTYLDAMVVRYAVFVEEQHVPAESEFDDDDPRSCYWVLYAEDATGSSGTSGGVAGRKPVGTIRLVPYPHHPHPLPGGDYRVENGELVLKGHWVDDDSGKKTFVPATAGAALTSPPGQATSLHDGHEPYVKIGRMAVDAAFRKRGLARQLVLALLAWVRENPTYFDAKDVAPSSAFKGLVALHAQVQALPFYERLGFVVDEKMGRWFEEGMEHCGMFLRVDLK